MNKNLSNWKPNPALEKKKKKKKKNTIKLIAKRTHGQPTWQLFTKNVATQQPKPN